MNCSRQGGFYITNTAAEAQEPRGGVWEERGQQCSRESGILNVKYLHKKVWEEFRFLIYPELTEDWELNWFQAACEKRFKQSSSTS